MNSIFYLLQLCPVSFVYFKRLSLSARVLLTNSIIVFYYFILCYFSSASSVLLLFYKHKPFLF